MHRQDTGLLHSEHTSKHSSLRDSLPWYTEDIHHTRQPRGLNEKTLGETGPKVHRQICVQYQNEVSLAIRQMEVDYYMQFLSDGTQKVAKMGTNGLLSVKSVQLLDIAKISSRMDPDSVLSDAVIKGLDELAPVTTFFFHLFLK